MEEIECKICGKKVKGKLGLSTHLRFSHEGMKLTEYEEKYGEIQTEEVTDENMKVHENKMNTEEPYEQNKIEKKMKISDVEWLDKKIKSEWVVVFEEDGIMQSTEPVAMGIITTETEQVPSLLIMATNGKLIPPWIFESFRGIYTHKELKAIEKSKKEEKKLQRNIEKEKERRNILKKLWQSQKSQKQDKLAEEDILNRIKASMDETEAISYNKREGRANTGFTNPNMFRVDMQRLARQSNNILNFKRKR